MQEDDEEGSRHGRALANAEDDDVIDVENNETRRPLLADPKERGLKRVGLVYSPRKSWWAGIVLVVLSIVIFVITIATAVL